MTIIKISIGVSMLVVDTNLEYLQKVLGISPVTFQKQYALSSIDEIIESEAEKATKKLLNLHTN